MRWIAIVAVLTLGGAQAGAAEESKEVGVAQETEKQEEREPVRMAIAGLTHTHVHWVLGREDRGDIEIVGIQESNRDLAGRYSRQHGFGMDLVYSDLEAMLEAVKPEAVLAFNPINEHLKVVRAAAPRGIHVMVEKPLAATLGQAREMARLAREHGILLLTNYETTWYGTTRESIKRVDEGELGQLTKIIVRDGHPGPVAIGVNEEFLEWLIDPVRNGGGALTDFGCYGANLITRLMKGARPSQVTAVTQQLQPEHYPLVEDEATVILTYPGTQGIIQASWNWSYSRKDMDIYGRKGALRTVDGARMFVHRGEKKPQAMEAPRPQDPEDDPFAYLAAIIRGHLKPPPHNLSSLENNLIVMEILEAARRSAESGRSIELR
ncbi:MAG TPA: Gfo/Idh/MocA family oxidoreductase [Acidobacteriota bacterium]|nr:Gfo/Idh/MocA family oxidoreductase [Acidobacteriota bacterium]